MTWMSTGWPTVARELALQGWAAALLLVSIGVGCARAAGATKASAAAKTWKGQRLERQVERITSFIFTYFGQQGNYVAHSTGDRSGSRLG